jgi:hypothetical protein
MPGIFNKEMEGIILIPVTRAGQYDDIFSSEYNNWIYKVINPLD